MERYRFSIKSLLSFIVICALGIAALRAASALMVAAIQSCVLLSLGVGILGIILQRGERRASWIGFVFFGTAYVVMALGPWDFNPCLVSLPVLDRLNLAMNPPVMMHRLLNASDTVPGAYAGDPLFESTSSEKADAQLAAIKRKWDTSKKWFIIDTSGQFVKSFSNYDDANNFFSGQSFQGVAFQRLSSDGHDPARLIKISKLDYSRSSEVSESFRIVGHGMTALLVSMFGTSVARFLYRNRDVPARAAERSGEW